MYGELETLTFCFYLSVKQRLCQNLDILRMLYTCLSFGQILLMVKLALSHIAGVVYVSERHFATVYQKPFR